MIYLLLFCLHNNVHTTTGICLIITQRCFLLNSFDVCIMFRVFKAPCTDSELRISQAMGIDNFGTSLQEKPLYLATDIEEVTRSNCQ